MATAFRIIEPVDLIAIDGQAVLGPEVELNPGVNGVLDLLNGDSVLIVRRDGLQLVVVVARKDGAFHSFEVAGVNWWLEGHSQGPQALGVIVKVSGLSSS